MSQILVFKSFKFVKIWFLTVNLSEIWFYGQNWLEFWFLKLQICKYFDLKVKICCKSRKFIVFTSRIVNILVFKV